MTTRHFTKQTLPRGPWGQYRKVTATLMIRIDGPFTAETAEGTVHCADGWLAIDANGMPYPVAAYVHEQEYLPASIKAHYLPPPEK